MTTYDASDFSTTGQCVDLYGHAVRGSIDYNAYGNTTVFNAVVLTEPVSLVEAVASSFTSSKVLKQLLTLFETIIDKVTGDSKTVPRPEHVSKFIVRARIDDLNSPHNFLPDPCSMAFADNPEGAAKIISLHTVFLSTVETSQLKIGVGDIIKVRLNQFSNGTYNLQYGEIVGLDTVGPPADQASACQKISELISPKDRFNFNVLGMMKQTIQDFMQPDDSGLRSYQLDSAACGSWAFFLIHPLQSATKVNSPMGYRKPVYADGKQVSGGRMHKGVDLRAATGTPVYAAAAGMVTATKYTSCGGNMLVIDHTSTDGNAYETRSFHMSRIDVEPNSNVIAGQMVGLSGNTGDCTTGPHLHFELRVNGSVADPLTYIKTLQRCPVPSTPPAVTTTSDPSKQPEADSDAEAETPLDS